MGAWSLSDRVRAHALVAGAGPAILEASGTTTWVDLDRRSDAMAAAVRAAGVEPGGVVAVEGEPSAGTVAAIVGVLRAGAIMAPLPAGLTAVERSVAMDVLRPALVLGDALAAAAPPARHDTPSVRFDTPAAGPDVRDATRDPEAPAVIVLTSGTTGRPKGVVLSGRAMAASATSSIEALPPPTGWVLALGLGHVAGLGILWRAIVAGVPVRIADRADPMALLAALAAEPPMSHVSLVPAQLARLLDAAGDAPPRPSLRAVLLGGGPIPPALVTRAVRAGWPVVPTYGLSETASGATALPTSEALEHPDSAGRALPGVSLRIEDPDEDGVGEILVETAARSSGYLGAATVPASEPVRTGDLGRLDAAGRLFVIDRRLDRIVRGGENIAPAEVEVVLLAHPAVADAVVIGRPDPLWGHVPVAAVVLRAGAADPGDEALASFARRSLAGFKVPVTFRRLDALPRTTGGKLRRGAVRALVAGERTGVLARPDGACIGWRCTGKGLLPLLLLHGTLSNAAQLDRLAARLARPGDIAVHALDRRGSGTGRLAGIAPIAGLDIAVHVADVVAYLDARGIGRVAIAGVSFGGVLGLELAARHPDRVAAVVAYEPPYGLLGDEQMRHGFGAIAAATLEAHRTEGASAAAETFLRAVAGDAAWDRLPERSRTFLAREGDGAAADVALTGVRPEDLAGITAAVTVITGGASQPFYVPIADALAARIPGARRVTLDGLDHPSPITSPAAVAQAIRAALAAARLVSDPEPAP